MPEQEFAARPRNCETLTPEELTKRTFINLQNNDSDNTPIVEVLDILSSEGDVGHTSYKNLTLKAQRGALSSEFDNLGRPIGTLQNLSSAYAEAIVLKELRNNTGSNESAIFKPATQARLTYAGSDQLAGST